MEGTVLYCVIYPVIYVPFVFLRDISTVSSWELLVTKLLSMLVSVYLFLFLLGKNLEVGFFVH